MAHRQWSQEQYVISVKIISITVNYLSYLTNLNIFVLNNQNILITNQIILIISHLKTFFKSSFFSLKNLKFLHKFNYTLSI